MMLLQTTRYGVKITDPYYPYYRELSDIKNISDLLGKVRELQRELFELNDKCNLWHDERHHLKYGIYFRGSRVCGYKLIPPIGRKISKEDEPITRYYSLSNERDFLGRFRRRSYYYLQRTLTIWEVMFLGRHFGLPTRLLDWTSGMYVALYFACEDYLDYLDGKKKYEDLRDGAVWALVRQPGECYDLNPFYRPPVKEGTLAGDFEFIIKGVKLIYPFYVSPRMTAQASIFTIQDKPTVALEEYPYAEYERRDFDIFHIRKWKVPKDKKKAIIEELADIGVDETTLFPDFPGLAKGIAQIEKTRRHKL